MTLVDEALLWLLLRLEEFFKKLKIVISCFLYIMLAMPQKIVVELL